MSDLNRREFVKATAATFALVVLGSELFADTIVAPLDVGTPADYPKDVVSAKYASQGVLILRKDDRIYALSSTCTHKGATVGVDNGTIKCHRHHSVFDESGAPVSGPAKTPLPHFAITLNDKGHLVVEKSKKVSANDPAASVKLA